MGSKELEIPKNLIRFISAGKRNVSIKMDEKVFSKYCQIVRRAMTMENRKRYKSVLVADHIIGRFTTVCVERG